MEDKGRAENASNATSSMVSDSTAAFLKFLCGARALQFGEFTLKSGRQSPYLFNAGMFNSGSLVSRLGDFYAHAIHQSGLEFDVLFGPAYKGIPLAVATAISLYSQYGKDVPYVINRKETKDHGEGGVFIGATDQLTRPPTSSLGSHNKVRVLIIDDVMTAGTALREVVSLLRQHNHVEIVGVVVALDREERTSDHSMESAASSVARELNARVIAIIRFSDLVAYVQHVSKRSTSDGGDGVSLCPEFSNADLASRIERFRDRYYGCTP